MQKCRNCFMASRIPNCVCVYIPVYPDGSALGLEWQTSQAAGPISWHQLKLIKGRRNDRTRWSWCLVTALSAAAVCAVLSLEVEVDTFQSFLRQVMCQEKPDPWKTATKELKSKKKNQNQKSHQDRKSLQLPCKGIIEINKHSASCIVIRTNI